jgi:biopolymer transport protein ExbB
MDWNALMESLSSGRVLMGLLWGCSVIAAAVIAERLLSLRRRRVFGRGGRAIELVRTREDLRKLHERLRGDSHAFSRIVSVVFETGGNEELVAIEGRAAIAALEKRLVVLEILAVVCPLMGLLGTVLGMNHVFHGMGRQGLGDFRGFSQGIALALRTTILGLCVAIPSYVAFLILERRADWLGTEIEYRTTLSLEKYRLLMEPGGAEAPGGTETETSEAGQGA